jgi:hypothetical protein
MFGLNPFWFWIAVATLVMPFAAYLAAYLLVRLIGRPFIRVIDWLEKRIP